MKKKKAWLVMIVPCGHVVLIEELTFFSRHIFGLKNFLEAFLALVDFKSSIFFTSFSDKITPFWHLIYNNLLSNRKLYLVDYVGRHTLACSTYTLSG